MKLIKSLLFLFCAAFVSFLFNACDDSGIIKSNYDITTSFTNLKPLNQFTEGTYEGWVSFNTADHGNASYVSIGKFNVNSLGEIIDTAGNPTTLKFKDKPANIGASEDAIVTIELPGDNDTIPGTRLMGGTKVLVGDYYIFDVDMKYNEILGSVAAQYPSDSLHVIYATPTTPAVYDDENFGIWFTKDTTGTQKGMTCMTIPDSLRWIYCAYVLDLNDNIIDTIGYFSDPGIADSDGPGKYYNVGNSGYPKPGQDYILNNPPIPYMSGNGFNSGAYRLMVSLVPKVGFLSPFFLKVFYTVSLSTVGYHQAQSIPNVTPQTLPFGQIKIAK
jgi:hypothetical protein